MTSMNAERVAARLEPSVVFIRNPLDERCDAGALQIVLEKLRSAFKEWRKRFARTEDYRL
jgi:hypothetical protein